MLAQPAGSTGGQGPTLRIATDHIDTAACISPEEIGEVCRVLPFDPLSSASGMLQPGRRTATCRQQNFPQPLAPRTAKFRRRQVLRIRCGPFGCSTPFRAAAYPRNDTLSKGVNFMRQLAQFLTATGRRLRALGKVAGHFFRKGKLGLKLAIKIPFFVEIEIAFETNWNRRR